MWTLSYLYLVVKIWRYIKQSCHWGWIPCALQYMHCILFLQSFSHEIPFHSFFSTQYHSNSKNVWHPLSLNVDKRKYGLTLTKSTKFHLPTLVVTLPVLSVMVLSSRNQPLFTLGLELLWEMKPRGREDILVSIYISNLYCMRVGLFCELARFIFEVDREGTRNSFKPFCLNDKFNTIMEWQRA